MTLQPVRREGRCRPKDEYRTASAGATGPEITETVGRLRPQVRDDQRVPHSQAAPGREGRTATPPARRSGTSPSLNGDLARPRLLQAALRLPQPDEGGHGRDPHRSPSQRPALADAVPHHVERQGPVRPLAPQSPSRPRPCRSGRRARRRSTVLFADMGRDLAGDPGDVEFSACPGRLNDGHSVEVLWPRYVDEVVRHDFQVLRNALLPYTADQVKAHREAAAARKAERDACRAEKAARGETTGPRVKLNRATYAAALSKDLNPAVRVPLRGAARPPWRARHVALPSRRGRRVDPQSRRAEGGDRAPRPPVRPDRRPGPNPDGLRHAEGSQGGVRRHGHPKGPPD